MAGISGKEAQRLKNKAKKSRIVTRKRLIRPVIGTSCKPEGTSLIRLSGQGSLIAVFLDLLDDISRGAAIFELSPILRFHNSGRSV